MEGFGFYGFDSLMDLSVEGLINQCKSIIQDEDAMERLENGNGLTDKQNILLVLWNELGNKTKFKNISLNYFDNITFESKSRLYTLDVIKKSKKNHKIKLFYEPRLNTKYSDNESNELEFDYYSLFKWFRKRNYLK